MRTACILGMVVPEVVWAQTQGEAGAARSKRRQQPPSSGWVRSVSANAENASSRSGEGGGFVCSPGSPKPHAAEHELGGADSARNWRT